MDKQIQLKLTLSSKETEKLIKDGLEAVSQITGLSRSRIAEEYILIGLSHVVNYSVIKLPEHLMCGA